MMMMMMVVDFFFFFFFFLGSRPGLATTAVWLTAFTPPEIF